MRKTTAMAASLAVILAVSASAAGTSGMNGKLKVVALEQNETLFTGKPFVKELNAYAFNFRNYDSTASRWTSSDPSGFPDGANSYFYAPCPLRQLDALGLLITVDKPTGNPDSVTINYNGDDYVVTAGAITVRNVSNQNIQTLNNLYDVNFQNSSSPPDLSIYINSYYARASGGIGGLYISLSAPSGYNFTQNITTNTTSSHQPNVPYADLHDPGSGISRNQDGSYGDLGSGNWLDMPSRSLAHGVNWTANLYIVQVSNSLYTVMGRLSYSFWIE